MAVERLQKIIAQAGVASRRAAEDIILQGRVRVNGRVIRELGSKADPACDTVEIDGQGVLAREPLVYIAMHKPIHVISTVQDPEGRTTVMDVLQQSRAEGARQFEGGLPRIYPVGRLDFDAEGLILLTNDGDLAHAMLHPRRHVPKTYMVKVRGRPEPADIERLRTGVRLRNEDGSLSRATAPAEVRVVKEGKSNTWLEMTLFEGRNHQVKRMCEAIGTFTIRLIRIDFGGVELDNLLPGSWRFLTHQDIKQLKNWQHAH